MKRYVSGYCRVHYFDLVYSFKGARVLFVQEAAVSPLRCAIDGALSSILINYQCTRRHP